MHSKPSFTSVIELNGIKNFSIYAGEIFTTMTNEDGSVRQDYARRENDTHGFPVNTMSASEFVTRANSVGEKLMQELILYYKLYYRDSQLPVEWRDFEIQTKLPRYVAYRLYRRLLA